MFRGSTSKVSLDAEKSTITGKLTKVYVSDGKQWGVIEWKSELAISAPKKNEPARMSMTTTFEGPIDGSSGEEKTVNRISAAWDVDDPKKGRVKVTLEIDEKTTHAPTR